MRWARHLGRASARTSACSPITRPACHSRYYSSPALPQTPTLPSWDLEEFRREAFIPQIPYRLPRATHWLMPACTSWFIHDQTPDLDIDRDDYLPGASELRTAFWSDFEDTLVPLELTTRATSGKQPEFHRNTAPLKILLAYLSRRTAEADGSIYLAQCPLPCLPASLLADIPTPEIVLKAGKGDVYDSSLWLGRSPTYTPLHRDPNPNLFVQLAGRKIVRLLPPDIGTAIFEQVQQVVYGRNSATLRGEEMMVGHERAILEAGVWESSDTHHETIVTEISSAIQRFGQQAELSLGEGLFIPKGWWHSVKGVGEGVTASVNWWFR